MATRFELKTESLTICIRSTNVEYLSQLIFQGVCVCVACVGMIVSV